MKHAQSDPDRFFELLTKHDRTTQCGNMSLKANQCYEVKVKAAGYRGDPFWDNLHRCVRVKITVKFYEAILQH